MNKVTMLDIANLAGVSKATVSMVINKRDESISQETRNKILTIAKEMNYIPNSIARSLSTKKTNTIGIILPDITNPFFSEMARAIEDGASSLGYNVIFCNTDNGVKKEEEYIELLIGRLVDGVIFITGGEGSKSVKRLRNNNVPFVLVDRYIEGYEDQYGVYCLNKDGIILGVKYLCDKGKKHIAFVAGPKETGIVKQRLEGYKESMSKYSVYDGTLVFKGELNIDGGIRATEELLSYTTNIDAIVYSNDIMALGGMKVLSRKGYKVPRDISIIGFDNVQISQFIEPELTTIAQPIYEMGTESCRLLIDIIDEKPIANKQIYFSPKLIIRGTT